MLAGCAPDSPPEVKLTNPDPSGKIPAIKRAVRQGDKSAASQLIKDLESDDPAVRFYAIEGLRRLTGEDFGYRYYDDEQAREPAVQQWKQWLELRSPTTARTPQ